MKPTRLIVLCAAVASVLLCVTTVHWSNRVLFGNVPHAHASGERLSLDSFRPDEQIVVAAAHGDRGVRKREYRFYWAAGDRYVDVLGNRDSMDYGSRMEKLVRARRLTDAEAEGLDAMVAYFRRRGEERADGSRNTISRTSAITGRSATSSSSASGCPKTWRSLSRSDGVASRSAKPTSISWRWSPG